MQMLQKRATKAAKCAREQKLQAVLALLAVFTFLSLLVRGGVERKPGPIIQRIVDRAWRTEHVIDRAWRTEHVIDRVWRTEHVIDRVWRTEHVIDRVWRTEHIIDRVWRTEHVIYSVVREQTKAWEREKNACGRSDVFDGCGRPLRNDLEKRQSEISRHPRVSKGIVRRVCAKSG